MQAAAIIENALHDVLASTPNIRAGLDLEKISKQIINALHAEGIALMPSDKILCDPDNQGPEPQTWGEK